MCLARHVGRLHPCAGVPWAGQPHWRIYRAPSGHSPNSGLRRSFRGGGHFLSGSGDRSALAGVLILDLWSALRARVWLHLHGSDCVLLPVAPEA